MLSGFSAPALRHRKQPYHLLAAVVDEVCGPAAEFAWPIFGIALLILAGPIARSGVGFVHRIPARRTARLWLLAAANPAPIHIDRPRAMRQHVLGDGAAERLACHDDRLPGGLQGRAPAGPLAGGVGGGGGFRNLLFALKGFGGHKLAAFPGVPANPGALNRNHLTLRPSRLVNRLAHVVRLREAAAVDPHHAVPNLPACVLNGTGEPVIGASPAERE